MTHKQKHNKIIITFPYTNRLALHNQHSASRWGLARAILRSGSVPLLKQCPAISSSRTAKSLNYTHLQGQPSTHVTWV